jgi:YrbI family 3-deoxy-D-manno-octulosonate 8-phosphate phosphatase
MTNWPNEWAPLSNEVLTKLSKLKMIIFDVDGVFTDGTILRDELGNEQRRFSVLDGHGISRLRDFGLIVGVVSREPSEITKSRMEKLKMDEIHVGSKDKSVTVKEILTRRNLDVNSVAFMGDDIPDLAAFSEVGIKLAPSNAQPQIRNKADWISNASGGNGAVREACEVIIYSIESGRQGD